MGTYGTFSGWIRWFDNDNEQGLLLGLKNGDVRIRGTADGTFEVLDADGVVVGELNEDGVNAVRGALAGMNLDVMPMIRERVLEFAGALDTIYSMAIDKDFAYVVCGTSPTRIVRVSLSDFDTTTVLTLADEAGFRCITPEGYF